MPPAMQTEHAEDEAVRGALRGEPGASPAEVGCAMLCRALHRAQQKLDVEHRSATGIWCAPLSLFNDAAQKRACADGVHDWAILTVLKARRLVEEAAGLGDLTEVYKAQILTAQREKRKVLRDPLLKHLERLEGLAEELHAHQPYLRAAKDAFSAPKAEDAKISGLPSSPHSVRHPADEKESPVVILQPRKDRSLFGSGLGRVPKEYMIKFLESAIDFVGAAATATGMSADVPTPPEEATAKATAKAMAAAKNAERLDGVAGRISSWLDVEVSDLVVWDPDPVDWTSSQNLWQRCRKTDRRWTLA